MYVSAVYDDLGRGEEEVRRVEPAGGEQRLVFLPLGQVRRLDIPDAIIRQLKPSQIKFPALGIHRQRDFAAPPTGLLTPSHGLQTLHALHLHAKRK